MSNLVKMYFKYKIRNMIILTINKNINSSKNEKKGTNSDIFGNRYNPNNIKVSRRIRERLFTCNLIFISNIFLQLPFSLKMGLN